MGSVRALLVQGNRKVGSAIHHFDLPAVVTCPGRSAVCERVCYANGQGRFRFQAVQERLHWCYEQSQRPDFAERLVQEIRCQGVLVLRIHVSGDFYSADYAAKWLDVMRRGSQVKFYFYTRSWRVPEVRAVLEPMAALRCCRAWYSIDAETGLPPQVPAGVRLAYLQVENDRPEQADLLFRVRHLRQEHRGRIGLPLVCPAETPEGHHRGTNCGHCGYCWR